MQCSSGSFFFYFLPLCFHKYPKQHNEANVREQEVGKRAPCSSLTCPAIALNTSWEPVPVLMPLTMPNPQQPPTAKK